jgi:hypothetical protein
MAEIPSKSLEEAKQELLVAIALRMEAEYLADPKDFPRPTVDSVLFEFRRVLAIAKKPAEESATTIQ